MMSEGLDGGGVYGTVFTYAMIIAQCGTAFLLFFYSWYIGALNLGEEPKWQMMESSEQQEQHE
jgi:hypothetical protein